ncbi:MAG: hypothetical protein K6U88_06305 [Dehalococcoidia bacterium]|nr:hypothetical protein [Dehalococcoidia bacterium]
MNAEQDLEFEGFPVDTQRRRLLRPDGSQVPLTPKAFDTLLFLLQRPGEVVRALLGLSENPIITELRLRLPPTGSGGAYFKLERRAGDFAVVGVAVQLTLDAAGVCQEIGIGLAGLGPTPIKPIEAEAVLRGSRLDEGAVTEAVHAIDRAIDPASDVRASAEYRREMAGVYVRRALERARARATIRT